MKPSIIDNHAHFFSQADFDSLSDATQQEVHQPYDLKQHLDDLLQIGEVAFLVNVWISRLPDSQHVFNSFKQMQTLQHQQPEKYGNIRLYGILKADPQQTTTEMTQQRNVLGVRIVNRMAVQELDADAYCTPEWHAFFETLIKQRKTVFLWVPNTETLAEIIRRVPAELQIGVDHLGACGPHDQINDEAFENILDLAAQRRNIFFEGPGYRTSLDVDIVAKYVRRIMENVGPDKLILQASDAPNTGNAPDGRAYRQSFPNVASAMTFCNEVAELACQEALNGKLIETATILSGNADKLYGL